MTQIISEYLFLIVLALIWILIAIIQDFRKREVPNWLNFSLVAIALAYRAFLSVFLSDYRFFVYGLVGFGLFFVLAYMFYYARVFAGGDAKLMIGLGPVLPFSFFFLDNVLTFVYFLIFLLVAGSIYGLFYSFVISFENRKKFGKELKKQIGKNRVIFMAFTILAVIVLILILISEQYLFSWFSLFVLLFPFLFSYAKAVEESSLIKEKKSKDLALGDWLYRPVKIGKTTIKPNWEGLNEKELKLLKKTKKKILIKEGIPFTPSFLFAFILLLLTKLNIVDLFYSLGI